MSFNTLAQSHLRPHSLSHSTLTRPHVTFNYFNTNTNTSSIYPQYSNRNVRTIVRPLLSNINLPNRQPLATKIQADKANNQFLSPRDYKRKKIFDKSHSNKDFSNILVRNSYQKFRDFAENREPIDLNQVKSKSSRRRHNIFQSYDPKTRLQTTQHQLQKNKTSKVINTLSFDRPVHPRKLTNYLQLTSHKVPKVTHQQSPVMKLSTEKQIRKIPLRDTYVAERDCQVKALLHKQQSSNNILQKEMYEIPVGKQNRSFTKKLQVGHLFTKSKNSNLNNLQFEEESIIGYSQRQTHPHDEQITDLPQLLLQSNDRAMVKMQKSEQNKSKGQSSSLVDIRLQTTVVSDKSQAFSKESAKYHQKTSKIIVSSAKKPDPKTTSYLLIGLGVLLLLIQLLK